MSEILSFAATLVEVRNPMLNATCKAQECTFRVHVMCGHYESGSHEVESRMCLPESKTERREGELSEMRRVRSAVHPCTGVTAVDNSV